MQNRFKSGRSSDNEDDDEEEERTPQASINNRDRDFTSDSFNKRSVNSSKSRTNDQDEKPGRGGNKTLIQ